MASRKSGELISPLTPLTTPATVYTGEVAFSVKVAANANWVPSKLPTRGTAYRNCTIVPKVRLPEFGDYLLMDIQGQGDYWHFYFGKNKTATELLTHFHEKRELTNLYWPPVLIDIEIAKASPRAVNLGDKVRRSLSYTATPVFYESADSGTLTFIRQFIGPSEFEIPQHPTPRTRGASFPVPGFGMFTFRDNLGPEINIPTLRDSDSDYDPVGLTVSGNLSGHGPRTLKATDPKTWMPYISNDSQVKLSTGAWLRTQIERVPPPLGPIQRGIA